MKLLAIIVALCLLGCGEQKGMNEKQLKYYQDGIESGLRHDSLQDCQDTLFIIFDGMPIKQRNELRMKVSP